MGAAACTPAWTCRPGRLTATEEGRADPQQLGTVLHKLSEPGWVKLNRVAETLESVGRVSPIHAAFVATFLERTLSGLGSLPRGCHHYLELLHAQLTSLDRPVAPELEGLLKAQKGSSKTAKLAKALLNAGGNGRGQRAANLEAWALRVEQAEAAERRASEG